MWVIFQPLAFAYPSKSRDISPRPSSIITLSDPRRDNVGVAILSCDLEGRHHA
jgi:hypothetical protein